MSSPLHCHFNFIFLSVIFCSRRTFESLGPHFSYTRRGRKKGMDLQESKGAGHETNYLHYMCAKSQEVNSATYADRLHLDGNGSVQSNMSESGPSEDI
jgi:hypothetical protein